MATRDMGRRRFLRLTTAGTAVGLTGCSSILSGSNNDSDGKGKTISYLSDRGDSKQVIDEIIGEFEKNHDYKVNVTYTSKGTSTDQQLQKMVAAGNPPDLIFDTSADAYRYQRDGDLAAISNVVQDSGLPDPVNVDGESYFAPTMVEPLMFWYRNDLYSSNPESWSKWETEAKQVSQSNNIKGFVTQSGQTNNADTQITQYLWQNDVEIYNGLSDNIQVTIDEGANRRKAVETYQWLKRMSQYSPNGSGWEWGDAIEAFQQENAAAIASVGGLPILTIAENRPDLVEKLSPSPYPHPEGTKRSKWWAYMEGHVVRNDGKATEGAKAFADFFSKSDKFMDFVLSAPLFQFPPTRKGLNSEAVKNNKTIQNHPAVMKLVKENWDSFSTILATGKDGAPNIVAADAYGQQLLGQSADQLLVGGKSPEQTVDWVAKQLRGLKN